MCISMVTQRTADGRLIRRPCGYCYQCVRKKKLDWEIRLSHAVRWADCSFFKLLTYDEKHYPNDPLDKSVIKDHIQRFIKRLRITLVRKFGDIKIKYFIVSEYGERKDRLHYHCLFFIKSFNPGAPVKFTWLEFNEICKTVWPYGIVGNCYRVTAKNIRYCCKYIQKSYNCKFFSRFELYKINPFLPYYIRKDYKPYDSRHLPSLIHRGKRCPVPYYWRKIVFTDSERVCQRVYAERCSLNAPFGPKELRYQQRRAANFWNKEGRDMRVPTVEYADNSDITPNLLFYVDI